MKTVKNLSGQKFGRLTVLFHAETSRTPNGTSVIIWLCRCSCGNLAKVRGSNLRTGTTKSCGCYRAEVERVSAITHGRTCTATYRSWRGMKERCLNPNNSHYKNYGGRGIKVCERWMEFLSFLEDMGERPSHKTLDRINNDGNYEPANCRWATDREQRANKRPREKVHAHCNSGCATE